MLAFFRLLLVACLSVCSILPETQAAELATSAHEANPSELVLSATVFEASISDATVSDAAPPELAAEGAHRLLSVALHGKSGESCSAPIGRSKRLGGPGFMLEHLAPASLTFFSSSGGISAAVDAARCSLVAQRIRLQI